MSTWKCLQYALVCFLGSHTLRWPVGGIYSLPHNYSRWIEVTVFCRQAHRTCIVHCPVPWPCQSTIWVSSSRPLDPTVTQTLWLTSDSPVLQREGASLRAPLRRLSGAHRTGYCSLSGALPGRWLTGYFMDFFTDSLGLFCF
jgi:hypothetical protein